MFKDNVISASACYTGGGIYVIYGITACGWGFFGDLDNGFYHLDLVEIPLTDDNFELAFDSEWFTHNMTLLDSAESRKLLIKALVWIDDNEPTGNYQMADLWSLFGKADSKMLNY